MLDTKESFNKEKFLSEPIPDCVSRNIDGKIQYAFANEQIKKTNKDLFIHDDLWTSFFLFYVKKIKIFSLQPHLKKTVNNEILPIYKKYIQDNGLIESYGKNINEAVRNRDQIAVKSLEYMFNKISKIKF